MMYILVLVLVFVLICACVLPSKNKLNTGILFFDIDATMSDMPVNDRDFVMQYCVNKGYDIGIITASDRPKWYLVNEDGSPNYEFSPWITPIMSKILFDTKFKNYNTMTLTGGRIERFPYFPEDRKMYGWKKGWQMDKAIIDGGYDRSKSYLFDDQMIVLDAVSEICHGVNLILVDNTYSNRTLDMSMIGRLLPYG